MLTPQTPPLTSHNTKIEKNLAQNKTHQNKKQKQTKKPHNTYPQVWGYFFLFHFFSACIKHVLVLGSLDRGIDRGLTGIVVGFDFIRVTHTLIGLCL